MITAVNLFSSYNAMGLNARNLVSAGKVNLIITVSVAFIFTAFLHTLHSLKISLGPRKLFSTHALRDKVTSRKAITCGGGSNPTIMLATSTVNSKKISYTEGDVVAYKLSVKGTKGDYTAAGIDDHYEASLGVIAPCRSELFPLCVRGGKDIRILRQLNLTSDSEDDRSSGLGELSIIDIVLYYDDASPVAISTGGIASMLGKPVKPAVEAVVETVVADACFSQRIVEDRISNPHGEHAEDVWIVSAGALYDLLMQQRLKGGRLLVNVGAAH